MLFCGLKSQASASKLVPPPYARFPTRHLVSMGVDNTNLPASAKYSLISLHLQLLHLFSALMIFRAEPNVQIKTNAGPVYK